MSEQRSPAQAALEQAHEHALKPRSKCFQTIQLKFSIWNLIVSLRIVSEREREQQLVLKRCLLEVANTMLAELYVMQRPCGAKHLWSAGKTRRVCPKRLTEVGVFAEKIKKKNSSIGKLDTHYCSGSVRGINRAVFSSSNLNANFECGFHIVEFGNSKI